MNITRRLAMAIVAGTAFVAANIVPTMAQSVTLNLAEPLPDGNFMVAANKQFADAVAAATNDEVKIVIHAGGGLGFNGPDLLRSVRDGLVPMANMAGVQQNGEDSIFDVEGLPFLVNNQEELAKLHGHLRPALGEVAARYNQKFLYFVPTPAQYLYTKIEVDTLDGLAGLQTRGGDKSTVDVVTALGMAGIFLPWGELVPALASGRVDAVVTSATSAVDGRFWEFLKYIYVVNGTGLSHIVSINLDSWNQISPENQAKIEELAATMQPEFWALSKAQGDNAVKVLQDNGMVLIDYPQAMRDDILTRTRPLLDGKLAQMPEANKTIVGTYLSEVGR
ncbi:MAG: TRAP transporter substrate-binding protein [Devosia sp.]|nr:TRAP transporter substrate-binding protein [Devosia sp.]